MAPGLSAVAVAQCRAASAFGANSAAFGTGAQSGPQRGARGQTAQATGSNSTALRQLAQATQLFSARQATPHMPRRLMPQSSAQGHTGRAGRFNRHQC